MLVVVLVKVALRTARRTSPRTGLYDRSEELCISVDAPGEQAQRHTANVGAVEVEPNAAPQGHEVHLREARIGTAETRDFARGACFHAFGEGPGVHMGSV
jgi:hypothetical protein